MKEIFALYISNYGSYKIKVYLDTIGVKTNSGKPFSEQAIRRILKNLISSLKNVLSLRFIAIVLVTIWKI